MKDKFGSAERRWISEVVVNVLNDDGAYRATKYVSPRRVISATRRRFNKKIVLNDKCPEISVRVGQPNYAEREFIKRALGAGEPFPIKKIQLKHV